MARYPTGDIRRLEHEGVIKHCDILLALHPPAGDGEPVAGVGADGVVEWYDLDLPAGAKLYLHPPAGKTVTDPEKPSPASKKGEGDDRSSVLTSRNR